MSVDPIPPPAWALRRAAAEFPEIAPEPDRTPRDRAGFVLGVAQALAGLAAAAGVYLLAGLAWALVIVGTVCLVLLVLVDWLRTRPPRPAPGPAPGGGR
jgi:hypothetical protein